MRRAGPRTPLMQAACVGGASQGRPGRGSLRFRTNGPVENVPFSTTGLCLGAGRCGGGGRASHVTFFKLVELLHKKPPLKGEVPAKRAEGFVPPRRKVAAALSAAVTTTPSLLEDAPNVCMGANLSKEESRRNSNAIRSSGEGVWGRGASLREAASPPESPYRKALREGARGRGLLFREAPSLAYVLYPAISFFLMPMAAASFSRRLRRLSLISRRSARSRAPTP